jgi:hypothetical protein
LDRHLGPPSLAVNTSYFALFSLVIWFLDDFLDVNCSSWSVLAFCHYAAFLGWLISAAQWKKKHPWHSTVFINRWGPFPLVLASPWIVLSSAWVHSTIPPLHTEQLFLAIAQISSSVSNQLFGSCHYPHRPTLQTK